MMMMMMMRGNVYQFYKDEEDAGNHPDVEAGYI